MKFIFKAIAVNLGYARDVCSDPWAGLFGTLFNYFRVWEFFGFRKMLELIFLRKSSSGFCEFKVKPNGIQHFITLRMCLPDLWAYDEIFEDREYEVNLTQDPKVIVDAGAHIGFSSIYFSNRYPDAKIISIEASSANFEFLVKNVAPYPNIIPVHAAVWKETTSLNLIGAPKEFLGFQVIADGVEATEPVANRIDGVTIRALLDEHGIEKIDLLKMDIEGAEKEVFETSSSWIDDVGVVLVETHERFKIGCNRSFYNATSSFEDIYSNGDQNVFFVSRAGLVKSTV